MKSKLLIFLAVVACLPLVTLAGGGQGFTPLVGIPGLPSDGSFDGYVDALYALAISIAALVAVVKIVLAGAKYMMDDIVTHKSEAKEDIKNALIGLLIIIGAVIILNTINSDLTNLAITAPPVVVDDSVPPPLVSEEVQELLDQCLESGGCNFEKCDALIESIYTIGGVGCAAGAIGGGATGGFIGSFTGPFAPYVSTILGGLGAIGGCAGGAYTSMVLTDELNSGVCTTGCSMMSGTFQTEGPWAGHCIYPKDIERYTRDLLDEYNREKDEESGTQDYSASQCVVVDGGVWNYSTRECEEKDTSYGYRVISNQQYVDPNGNPQEVCTILEEQLGISVEYVENIRSCRWEM